MSKTDLQQEWEQRLNEFRASGETATAWCAARNINLSRFWYWSRKLRIQRQEHATEKIQWLSVRMDEPSSKENTLTVQVGSARIEVRSGFNPTLLQKVVQALTHAQ